MDLNNPQNQSYWFVLREDQSNVILSSNNFTIQNPPVPGQDARYVVDSSENRQFIQLNEIPIVLQDTNMDTNEKESKLKDDEIVWDRYKIQGFLTLFLEEKFRNIGKDKELWNEVANNVGISSEACFKKYKNLRRTYIRLLKKKRLGKDIKWIHYNTCEEVFKDCKSLSPSELEPWEEHKVRHLLSLYIENLYRFRNPECLQKDIWVDIASRIGTTEYNCYHKFKNLKRAYFTWLQRSHQTGKPIKWPYYNYFERIFYNYSPSVGLWNRVKTKALMDAYIPLADKFKNSKYLKKELWKEVSNAVGASPLECDKKFRNLKQTYIRLKMKARLGRSITKWRYYKDFESIYSPTVYDVNENGIIEKDVNKLPDDHVTKLLTFYLENKKKFNDPLVKKRYLWKMIGHKIGMTSEECDRKFRNLKQTYLRLAEKKKETGKCTKWPYYTYFEKIFHEDPSANQSKMSINTEFEALHEIGRFVQKIQNKNDDDMFETLVSAVEESNKLQRERNKILQALLDRQLL